MAGVSVFHCHIDGQMGRPLLLAYGHVALAARIPAPDNRLVCISPVNDGQHTIAEVHPSVPICGVDLVGTPAPFELTTRNSGDKIYQWNPGAGLYIEFTWTGSAWSPAEPSFALGDAFWRMEVQTHSPGSARQVPAALRLAGRAWISLLQTRA
jgi:hypothetical protein